MTFQAHFLQAQRQCIPIREKAGKGGNKPLWMNKEVLSLLKCKPETYRRWKQDQAPQSECREAVRVSRNETRKAKTDLELNLAKDFQDNKKGFFKSITTKGKLRINFNTKGLLGPLANGGWSLVTGDTEKAVLLNDFFAPVFTDKTALRDF